MEQKKKIKILHIIPNLNKGGAERLLRDLLVNSNRSLFEHGVVLIKRGVTSFWEQELTQCGIRIFKLNKSSRWDFWSFGYFLFILAKQRPDIIHSHLFLGHFYARLAKLFCWWRPKLLSTEQGMNSSEKNFQKKIRLFSAFLSDKVAAVSAQVAENTSLNEGVSSDKCLVIHNAVDVAAFSFEDRKYQAGKPLVIGSVSRLEKPKDYETLFLALTKLDPQSFVCKVAGDGSLRKDLESLVISLGLADKVSFVGMIDNVKDFLLSIDIFVLSSRSEGLPLSLLEAAATGLPLVASRISGIMDVVDDGQNGLLFSVGQSDDLTGKLNFLLNNSNERRKYGLAAQKKVRDRFSIKKIVEDYEKVYRSLLGIF